MSSNPGIAINLEQRKPDCLAPLIDSPGDAIRQVPVCMGGAAIIGCTHADECLKKFSDNEQPAIALMVHEDKIVAVPLGWALKTFCGIGSDEAASV